VRRSGKAVMASRSVPKAKTKLGSTAWPSGQRREGEGACVVLGRRSRPGSPLRLGTLSWGIDETWSQSPDEFLASVSAAAHAWGICDLAVVAGLTITGVPSPNAVLSASGGTPVLFEVQGEGGERPWLVVYNLGGVPRQAILRRRQLAQRFNDHDGFRLVAGAVAGSAGVIEFEDTDLSLVLLICGENNSVDPYAARSVFKRLLEDPTAAVRLREVVGGRWVMLNPAHAGYYPHALPTGFGKVGVVQTGEDRQAGPTLRWLVEREDGYRDGTAAPLAVVHVNNYDISHDETVDYAAVTFGDTVERVQQVAGPVTGEIAATSDGTRLWRACVFGISVGQDRERRDA
jgi:hypothetical protein